MLGEVIVGLVRDAREEPYWEEYRKVLEKCQGVHVLISCMMHELDLSGLHWRRVIRGFEYMYLQCSSDNTNEHP